MPTKVQASYGQLREQLQTWKAKSPLHSHNDLILQRFLATARETLISELHDLAHVLEEGGLRCEVLPGNVDNVAVGIRVDPIGAILMLSPADNPACIRALIAGGSRPDDVLEWFIPYHQIVNGGLERELQAAMIRLLRRSSQHPSDHSKQNLTVR